jgi:flagellar biosynthesis regulator FlbT
MALKLTVKPGESFFVGTAEITVQCDTIVSVLVGGRLQLAVQQMYLSGDVSGHHVAYFEAVQALLATAPQHAPLIAEVNRMLMDGASYKAIKLLKCISNPELTENRARLKLVS